MINILSKEALFAVSNSGKVIIVSKITYEPQKTEDEDDFFSKVGVVNKKVDIYSSNHVINGFLVQPKNKQLTSQIYQNQSLTLSRRQ